MCRALVALVAACLILAARAHAAPDAALTQSHMRAILDPLAEVLPYSFDRDGFVAAKNRGYISARLRKLDDETRALERHATTQDRGFEFVAQSLARDVANARRHFERAEFDQARFTLHNLTENCIACHARLGAASKSFPAMDRFFAALKPDTLSPLEHARFDIVSRRFDEAANTLESVLSASDLPPQVTVAMASMVDYLRVCLAVKKDAKRPAVFVESLLARTDVPRHTRALLDRWRVTLRQLEKDGTLQKASLADARTLIAEGRRVMEFPRDRDGLVHFVAASGILNDYIHAQPDRGRDVAEAYYLLGTADALLEHSPWISRMESELEAAIRLAPGADFAPKAYAVLEEAVVSGYSGSSGTHLPQKVEAFLRELREQIAAAQLAPKS